MQAEAGTTGGAVLAVQAKAGANDSPSSGGLGWN